MDENQQSAPEQRAVQEREPVDVEALIALIEERVIENLTRIIERMAQRQNGTGTGT